MGVGAKSVQWGAWANAGMATQSPATQARFQRMGVGFIAPHQGLSALATIMHAHAAPLSVTAAAVMDWGKYLQQDRFNPIPTFLDEVADQAAMSSSSVPAAVAAVTAVGSAHSEHTDSLQDADCMLHVVGDIVERVVGVRVGADAPLMAAGIDSLGAVELRDALQEALGVQLPGALLFDYPTISTMAAHLASLIPSAAEPATLVAGPTLRTSAGGHQMSRDAGPMLQEVHAQVGKIVKQVMGMEMGPTEPLMAAGLDSLGAVELRDSIQEAFGVQMTPTMAMDFPTVVAISSHLISQMPHSTATAGGALIANPTQPTLALSQSHARQMQPTAVAIVGMATHSLHSLPTQSTSGSSIAAVVPSLHVQDAVGCIPTSRWDAELQGRMAGLVPSRFASLLGRVDGFDGDAFGVSHVEAALMDPQQRLLLEAAAEAMSPAAMHGMGAHWASGCGVFVGASWMDYGLVIRAHQGITPYSGTGTASSAISGRLAFTFGLQGPTASGKSPCTPSGLQIRPSCSTHNIESSEVMAQHI